jgi:hypothetical protein
MFYAKINDMTSARANRGKRIALDQPYWVMRLAPYRLIRTAIKMAHKAGACFSVIYFLSCISVDK